MLNLPSNFQLVGAVFVESRPASISKEERDLVPSMDREGFLKNEGYAQLFAVIRAGMEFLAVQDKTEIERVKAEEAKAAAKAARHDFRKAIEYFENSPTLAPEDKSRVITEYSQLAERFEEQETYHKQTQQNLTTMSLLGVVAGFMTHESRAIVARLEETVVLLTGISKAHPEILPQTTEIEKSLARLVDHLDYTSLFIDATRNQRQGSFPVAPQVDLIVERFGNLAEERGINVICDISDSVNTPILPIAAYSSGDQSMVEEVLPASKNDDDARRRQIRLIGYWLWDSILRFPGLILGEVAAASYLNIAVDSFKHPELQKPFAKALYNGPFADKLRPRWWRSTLDELLEAAVCFDGREFIKKKIGKRTEPCHCSVKPSLRAGYYCMLTDRPVSLENSKAVTWFPSGADLARASTPAYQKRGPWLGEF